MPNNAELKRATARARRLARRQRAELVANPRVQFADWLKRAQPEVYKDALQFAQASAGARRQALAQANAKAAGVFDTGLEDSNGLGFLDWGSIAEPIQTTTEVADKSFWEKFIDGATAVGTSYLALKNQKDLLELNIERAKLGQAPLDAATTAPVVRTQIGIDPETAAALASNVGSSINKNMLMVAGVALVIMFFVMRK